MSTISKIGTQLTLLNYCPFSSLLPQFYQARSPTLSTRHSPDLATVLKSRLARAREILQEGEYDNVSGSSLQVVQYITAKESLRLL
jgi:hypothetical protein